MPAGSTYTPIATVSPSGTTTVDFTSISGSYTDLVLVFGGSMASAANMFIRVGNGSLDTGSNYSTTGLIGTGSSAVSQRMSNQTEYKVTDGLFFNTSEQCNLIIQFQNYSNTTTYKSILTRANSAGIGVSASVGLWRSTSAINTIRLYGSQNFNSGSVVTLYGLAAA
jgi:hypothetical protein